MEEDISILESQPWAAPLVARIRELEKEQADLKRKTENQKANLAEMIALSEETQKFVAEREKQMADLQSVLDRRTHQESDRVKELSEALEAAKEILQEQVDTAKEMGRTQLELDKAQKENEELKKKAAELAALLGRAQQELIARQDKIRTLEEQLKARG
jgi:chromosome segregation ATPase